MRSPGFTLIEIMVVVAIIGIVAAIAYPSYQGYIQDTYRANAVADLERCAQSLERFYSNGFTYVGADTNTICDTNSPSEGPTRFVISYETLTATAFMIRATPVGETCGTDNCIEMTQTGVRTTN
jgi:type IV pilus assembly protein PilE